MKNTAIAGTTKFRHTDPERRVKDFQMRMEGTTFDFWVTVKQGKIEKDSRKRMEKALGTLNQQSLEHSRIETLVDKVEKFIKRHKIEQGNFDFSMLVGLSSKTSLSNHAILGMFINRREI